MLNQSHLTARARTALSAPAADLLERGLLAGRILDYGCGRGDLRKFLNGDIEQWDPHFHPKKPKGKFDVVCCIYVLNVLGNEKRAEALAKAKEFVRVGGSLYVAVRRDLTMTGRTKRGTEQWNLSLAMDSLVHREGSYEIYVWKREKNWQTSCPNCGAYWK